MSVSFGDLPIGARFTLTKGPFSDRPFRKTAISPGTTRSGGNAVLLGGLSRKDGDMLRHPGLHPRTRIFRLQDKDAVVCADKALHAHLSLMNKVARGGRKGKSEWFFDISPSEIARIEEEMRLPKNRAKLARKMGCL